LSFKDLGRKELARLRVVISEWTTDRHQTFDFTFSPLGRSPSYTTDGTDCLTDWLAGRLWDWLSEWL